MLSFLIIEDDLVDEKAIRRALRRDYPEVTWGRCDSPEDVRKLDSDASVDLVILDHKLGSTDGLTLLPHLCQWPVIMVTGSDEVEVAVTAMKNGAVDFIIKDGKGAYLDMLPRTVANVLERRRLEEERERVFRELEAAVQSYQLESAKNKMIARLAGGIAHEVKKPMAAMKLGVEYMNQHAEDIPKAMRGVIHDIEQAIPMAQSILDGLLDLSKPTSLLISQATAGDVVETAIALMRHEIDRSQTKVSRVVDERLPTLQCDRTKILQVVMNLVGNAIQAMGQRGALEVAAFVTEDGRHVKITVRDHGPGIPADQLESIFESFYTTKAEEQGTGLGLDICRVIMEQHGGAIEIENHPEGGALGTLTLPVATD